jgi:hypothetical protein
MADLQIAEERFAADQKFVGQDVPRTKADAAALHQALEPGSAFGTNLEIVGDDDGLAVEVEVREGGVAFEQVDEAIHQPYQAQAELLERLVPLAIPVGVWHDDEMNRRNRARQRLRIYLHVRSLRVERSILARDQKC